MSQCVSKNKEDGWQFIYNERMYLVWALRDKDLLQIYLKREELNSACTSIALAKNLPFLRLLRREGCP